MGEVEQEKASGGTQQVQRLDKTISKKVTCDYLLYLPVGYGRKEQAWPLIMVLHAAGERGDDLNKIKNIGPLAYMGHVEYCDETTGSFRRNRAGMRQGCPHDVWKSLAYSRLGVSWQTG